MLEQKLIDVLESHIFQCAYQKYACICIHIVACKYHYLQKNILYIYRIYIESKKYIYIYTDIYTYIHTYNIYIYTFPICICPYIISKCF